MEQSCCYYMEQSCGYYMENMLLLSYLKYWTFKEKLFGPNKYSTLESSLFREWVSVAIEWMREGDAKRTDRRESIPQKSLRSYETFLEFITMWHLLLVKIIIIKIEKYNLNCFRLCKGLKISSLYHVNVDLNIRKCSLYTAIKGTAWYKVTGVY